MNKIIVDNKINSNNLNINSDSFIICDTTNNSLELNIIENTKVFLYIKNSNINININLNNNLDIILFVIDSTLNINIDINKQNTKLIYNYRNININDNNYILNINHNNKNTISIVTNNGINIDNNKLNYIINGYVKKESTNAICNQDSKIIVMKDNNSSIKPNLIIDNNEIDANHSSYIGFFPKEKLFYLKSRGIDENNCLKLLIKAFLLEKLELSLEEKELILNEIDMIGR